MRVRLRRVLVSLFPWLRRRQADAEIQKELDLHLELETESTHSTLWSANRNGYSTRTCDRARSRLGKCGG